MESSDESAISPDMSESTNKLVISPDMSESTNKLANIKLITDIKHLTNYLKTQIENSTIEDTIIINLVDKINEDIESGNNKTFYQIMYDKNKHHQHKYYMNNKDKYKKYYQEHKEEIKERYRKKKENKINFIHAEAENKINNKIIIDN